MKTSTDITYVPAKQPALHWVGFWYFQHLRSVLGRCVCPMHDFGNNALQTPMINTARSKAFYINHIGGVMVSLFDSGVVDRAFETWSGQSKDYKIDICCFSDKHSAFRSRNKDWLVGNHNNFPEWRNMSTADCCFIELVL